MDKHFTRSSLDYEFDRVVDHARKEMQPYTEQPSTLPYAVENSLHILENEVYEDMQLLMECGVLWQYLMPAYVCNRRQAALANRLISGIDCVLEATITNSNRLYPTRRYRCLHSERCAREVRDDDECLFDDVTAEMVRAHRNEPLHRRGPQPLSRLAFLASQEMYDVIVCENWHVVMRNREVRTGSHGKGEQCDELFASLTIDRQRARFRRVVRLGSKLRADAASATNTDVDSAKRSRKPSTWNAIQHKRSLEGAADKSAKASSAAYKDAIGSQEEMDKLASMVNTATLASGRERMSEANERRGRRSTRRRDRKGGERGATHSSSSSSTPTA